MGGDAGLVEEDRPVRIDSGGDQRRHHLAAIGGQFRRVIVHGNGVQIGKEEQAFALVLHLHPVLDRAQIIAEMEITRGLDARYRTHCVNFLRLRPLPPLSFSSAW